MLFPQNSLLIHFMNNKYRSKLPLMNIRTSDKKYTCTYTLTFVILCDGVIETLSEIKHDK